MGFVFPELLDCFSEELVVLLEHSRERQGGSQLALLQIPDSNPPLTQSGCCSC